MERQRPAVVLAFIAFAAVIAALSYYEAVAVRKPAETATAQSVAPPAAPAAEVAPVAEAALPATDATPPAATAPEVAMIKPTETLPAVTPPAMPGAPVMPSFDVVRVEPTGEAVVAGQAEPDSKVEVLDGTTTIATAEANERGEWALAIDKPLPPGPHDLAVRTTSKDQTVATLSDQRVTVSVPEPGSKDVLVVVNTPDAASKVLQVPGSENMVASLEQPPAGGKSKKPGEDGAATDAGTAAPQQDTQVAMAEPALPRPSDDAQNSSAMQVPAEIAEAPATSGEPQVATAEPGVPSEPPIAAEPPIAGEPQVASEAPLAAEPPVKTEPPIATEPEVAAKQEAPPPKPEVAVAAVEADTAGSVYIAGTVKTGETVRVYLDDKPLGEAQPSPSGTWLIETKKDLPAGKYTVRADQVDSAGTVIARSEVPFEREVEVAILKPSGAAGGDTGATLTGAMPEMETVIIKRGDNLWRIARGAWGQGVRWSTIYQANTDQIRNPHWIYPGQVFIMPKGSVTWTN
jgi:hypothetical protein